MLSCLVVATGVALPAFAQEQADCLIQPKMTLKLGTQVPGLIREMLVDRGAIVKKGDVIARLESGVEAAAVLLAEARASNESSVRSGQAKVDYQKRKEERMKALRKNDTVAFSAADEAETLARVAENELDEAKVNLQMAQTEVVRAREILNQRIVRSPIDGVVVARTLGPGEYAFDQGHLVTVAQIDPLYVEVYVPLKHFGRIRIGMQAEVYPEEPVGGVYKAVVTVVDQVFDAASGTIGVRLELPNPDYAIPAGLKCQVRRFLAQDTGLAPSSLPPSGHKAIQIERTSLPNAPLGLSQPAATSPENSPPSETNGGQRPAPENDPPLIASQPLAATSLTTPIAQGQTPKPQSPEVDEALPDADRKPPKAVNSDSSVAVPPHAAALPVAISAVGQSPNPPSPENKDVTEVGAQPSPPGNGSRPLRTSRPLLPRSRPRFPDEH